MANDIKFNRGRGGLGRALAGKDHVSGLLIAFNAAGIALVPLVVGVKTIFSVQDADDLGINYGANEYVNYLRYILETTFQANKKAIVHLKIVNDATANSITNGIKAIQNTANGEIRQMAVIEPNKDFAAANLIPIQTACDILESEHKPLIILYSCNTYSNNDLTDLRTLDNKNVSVVIGGDYNGKGKELADAHSFVFTCIGLALGFVSRAKVSENIGWIGQFNANKNDTNEFDVLGLEDAILSDYSQTEQDDLNTKGYIFLKKHVGKAGSYFNDTHTAINKSSDYAYIENVRTIDKAVRGCRTFLLPQLNAPLLVSSDGELSEDTIASFKNDTSRALEEMQRVGEISAFDVKIDPKQKVLSTSKIIITITIVPVGVARNIVVNIGFGLKIQN